MEEKYCQSCAMPLGNTDETHGTNADGSRNEDYCNYCYDKGAYTSETSMDEMIGFCLPHTVAANPGVSEEETLKMMQAYFPTLKRWKQN